MTSADRGAIQSRARAAFLTLSRTPRASLRWVTVIIAAKVVDATDDLSNLDWVSRSADEFVREWRRTLMRSGRIGREGTRWAGVIEIDLLHPRLLGGGRKQTLLRDALGIADAGDLTGDSRVAVLHAHLVADVRGHDPDVLSEAIRKKWAGPWRVVSKPLSATETVSVNLERLASYSTKFRFRYSEAWEGRPTKFYGANYEPQWAALMNKFYGVLETTRLVFGSIKSRAESECISRLNEPVATKGKADGCRRMQLMNNRPMTREENESNRNIFLQKDAAVTENKNDTRSPSSKYVSRTSARDRFASFFVGRTSEGAPERSQGEEAAHARAGAETGRARPESARADQKHSSLRAKSHSSDPGEDRRLAKGTLLAERTERVRLLALVSNPAALHIQRNCRGHARRLTEVRAARPPGPQCGEPCPSSSGRVFPQR